MSHLRFTDIDPQIEKQVDNLLAQMTLEEKVGQMVQIDLCPLGMAEAEKRIKAGQVGSILTVYDIDNINHLQKVALEESRLGIPFILGNDVIHGFRTIFPIPLAESCTWEPGLLEETARIASEEASANGTHWIFAPMVDICRDPRWGRIAEGAGEDPFLGEVLARARVRGFQAANLQSGRKIVACPKHYAAYGWAEAGKDYNTVDVSERTLRDVILPPFKAAFDEGAGTVMSAFNELNGVPISANAFLLRQILRNEWGYSGVVLSDYDAVEELIPHGMAADLKEATRLSILGGVDMDMVCDGYHLYLADLVREGAVPETLIDEAVRRILRLKLDLGLSDAPYVDKVAAQQAILKPEYKETALEVTQKSMVLLKNENNLLPLDPANKHIALIGPLADDHHEILGTWHRIGRDEDAESVLDGFKAVLPESAKLSHVQGCELAGDKTPNFTEAISVAQSADIAVLVLGEGEYMSGEAHSRAYLDLPGHQLELLQAVHATGTPTVVVLMSGRPLVIPWLVNNIPAILQAWHGGIRTGRAVADILLGHINPSGKLTASWPRTEGQIPVYYGHKNTGRPVEGEGTIQFNKIHHSDYLDELNSPQFPFGFGLSYTTFEYNNLQVETPHPGLNDSLVVSIDVANTGNHAGDEIVQLYVRDLVGSVTRPVKELKGFQKVSLEAGQQQTVRFEVPVQKLGFHGLDMSYGVEPGAFKVWVGPNSAEGLAGDFTVAA
jgi:beta-glucosidase